MPALTLDTSQDNGQSQSNPRSASPVRPPPYSPITPTLSTSRPVYTHDSQAPPVPVPQLPPQQIDFSTNPDVLALKATISILQQQKRIAENDMRALAATKERALGNPEAFATALGGGKIRMRGDELFTPSGEGPSDVDEDLEDAEELSHGHPATQSKKGGDSEHERWDPLPNLQNVVRMPSINWEQYGVVGDSLDKMHKDQLARPVEGAPQKIGPDGQFRAGLESQRRHNTGVAAPYNPLKDKIEKPGPKKTGKK